MKCVVDRLQLRIPQLAAPCSSNIVVEDAIAPNNIRDSYEEFIRVYDQVARASHEWARAEPRWYE